MLQFTADIRRLPIADAIRMVPLVDPEHVFLQGSRAVEALVGRTALLAAREAHGVLSESGLDIDLVVSRVDYTQLRRAGARIVRHAFPRVSGGGRYRLSSLSLFDGGVDIWRERWYEPARYPRGIVGPEELEANSTWDTELGVRVPTRDYLRAQRQRSVAFLEEAMNNGELSRAQTVRLEKDRADLEALGA